MTDSDIAYCLEVLHSYNKLDTWGRSRFKTTVLFSGKFDRVLSVYDKGNSSLCIIFYEGNLGTAESLYLWRDIVQEYILQHLLSFCNSEVKFFFVNTQKQSHVGHVTNEMFLEISKSKGFSPVTSVFKFKAQASK